MQYKKTTIGIEKNKYTAQKRWWCVIVGIIRHIAVTCSLGHNQICNYTRHLPHGSWLSPSLFNTYKLLPDSPVPTWRQQPSSISNWLAGWRFQTLPRFFVVAWCPSSCTTMQHSAACGLIYLHTPGEFRIPLVTLRGYFYCFATGWSSPFVDVTALVCWWRGTPDNHGRTNVNISYLQRLNSVKKIKNLNKEIIRKNPCKEQF